MTYIGSGNMQTGKRRTLPPKEGDDGAAWEAGIDVDEPEHADPTTWDPPGKIRFEKPAYPGPQLLVCRKVVVDNGPDGSPFVFFIFQGRTLDSRGVPREAMTACRLKRTPYRPDLPRATHLDWMMYCMFPDRKVGVDEPVGVAVGRCIVGNCESYVTRRKLIRSIVNWSSIEPTSMRLEVRIRTSHDY